MKKIEKKEFHNSNIEKVQKQKGPFSFLVWIFKVEIIILIIFLLINIIPDKVKFIAKYNIEKQFAHTINNNQNIDDFQNALNNNKYLSENDREIINKFLKQEIEENYNYIDMKQCVQKIKSLKVIRKNEKYEIEKELNIAGSYSKLFNKIDIYTNDDEMYFHELNHLISKNNLGSSFKIDLLSEIVNEHFSQEYINSSNAKGYEQYMFYSYVLAELLPEDILRKYKFSDNEDVLITALLEIDSNIDEVYRLISSITLDGNYKNFRDSYEYFYEKKYNRKIEDDISVMIYLYNSPVVTDQEREKVKRYLELDDNDEIKKIIPKGYFSNRYKSEHKNIVVEYIKNDKEEMISV